MDPLDFLTQDALLDLFHRKKTEMSCMDQPLLFLRQLRDYNLVPEELYMKVSRIKTKEEIMHSMYEVLDTLETNQPECVKSFWECVFKDHIMQRYPTLRSLRDKLTSDCSFSGKRKDAEGENEELKELSTLTREGRKDIWNLLKYKTQLPVTCGDKEGVLHRDKLARGERCIFHQDCWYTPPEFERLGGRERSRKWKTSICCKNIPLQKLIEKDLLKCPPAIKRTSNSRQRRSVRLASCPRTYATLCDDMSSEEESSSSYEEEDSSEGDQTDEGEEERKEVELR